MAEREERDKDRVRVKFNPIMNMLYKWPEDRIKTMLKERLETEGWTITQVSMGSERGKDLEAVKDHKVIHIEAKGEPRSPSSYQSERRSFIGGALASLIAHMNEKTADNAFCMAFPDNDYYLRGVRTLVPLYVRNKLRLFTIFLKDDSPIMILLPDANDVKTLNRFEELFNAS
jgi:hypothetical protein